MPKKKQKRCICMISVEEAKERVDNWDADRNLLFIPKKWPKGLVRCPLPASESSDYCIFDKDCANKMSKSRKKKKKKSKSRKKKKRKKQQKMILGESDDEADDGEGPQVPVIDLGKAKKLDEEKNTKYGKKRLSAGALKDRMAAAAQIERLRNLVKERYPTLPKALVNSSDVVDIINTWRPSANSKYLKNRLNNVLRSKTLFIKWLYTMVVFKDANGTKVKAPASGEILLKHIPNSFQIENELAAKDDARMIVKLQSDDVTPAEVFKVIETFISPRGKMLSDTVKSEFKKAPRKILDALRSLRDKYSSDRDLFAEEEKEMSPLDYLQSLLKSSCVSKRCDQEAVDAVKPLIGLDGEEIPPPATGDELCAELGCGECKDTPVPVLDESGRLTDRIRFAKRCSPREKPKTGIAYHFVVLMKEYEINKLRAGVSLQQTKFDEQSQNLEALLLLAPAYGGIGMTLKKAETLYAGIQRIRGFKELIYKKVKSAESEEDLEELGQALRNLNSSSDPDGHLSLDDFGADFPILITGHEVENVQIETAPVIVSSGGELSKEEKAEAADTYFSDVPVEKPVYRILLTTQNWSPLRFDSAIGDKDDARRGEIKRKIRSIREAQEEEIKITKAELRSLDEDDEKKADQLRKKIEKLEARKEKGDLSRGLLEDFLSYELKMSNELHRDSVEAYLKKYLIYFVSTFVKEFIVGQEKIKRDQIKNQIVEKIAKEAESVADSRQNDPELFSEPPAAANRDQFKVAMDALIEDIKDDSDENPQINEISNLIDRMVKEYFTVADEFLKETETFATEVVLNAMPVPAPGEPGITVRDLFFAISDLMVLFSPDLEERLGSSAGEIPGEAYRTQIYMRLVSSQQALVATNRQYFRLLFSTTSDDGAAAEGRLNRLSRSIASAMGVNAYKFLDSTRRDRHFYLVESKMIRDLFDRESKCGETEDGPCLCFMCRRKRDQGLSESCASIKDKTPWDQIVLYEVADEEGSTIGCFDIFVLRDRFNLGDFTIPDKPEIKFNESFIDSIKKLDLDAIKKKRDEYRLGISNTIHSMIVKKDKEINRLKQEKKSRELKEKFFDYFDRVVLCMKIPHKTLDMVNSIVVEIIQDLEDQIFPDEFGSSDEEEEVVESSEEEEEEDEVVESSAEENSSADDAESSADEDEDNSSFGMGGTPEPSLCPKCKQIHLLSLKQPAEIRKDVYKRLTSKKDPKASEKAATAETAHLDDDSDDDEPVRSTPAAVKQESVELPSICEFCKRDLAEKAPRYFYTVVSKKDNPEIYRYIGFHVDCFDKGGLHFGKK